MRTSRRPGSTSRSSSMFLGALVAMLVLLSATPLSATTATTDAPENVPEEVTEDVAGDVAGDATGDAALIGEGLAVYATACQGCHQAGGVGIDGTYPPLLDNPRADDTEYLVDTIVNGRQDPLEVDGVQYTGVMPAFSTLSDTEVDGLVALIQADFVVPEAAGVASGPELPVATGSLPGLANLAMVAAFAVAVAVALFVMSPRLIGQVDRLSLPWLDAWMRSALIVVSMVLAVAIIPSMVLKTETVARLDRAVQDVIGLVLWGGGLLAGLGALWWFHRDRRI